MLKSREVLQAGDAEAIVELLQDIGGPVAPANPREALGLNARQHKVAAGLLATLAVRRAVGVGGATPQARVEKMKDDLAAWVEHGSFVGPRMEQDPDARQAEAIAELIADTARSDGVSAVDVARLRLAIVAPLAPPLESLRIMARLDEGFLRDAPTGPAAGAAGGARSADEPSDKDAVGPVERDGVQPDRAQPAIGESPTGGSGVRSRLFGVMNAIARWRSRQG